MNRRQFLSLSGMAAACGWWPASNATAVAECTAATLANARKLLVLIELKGGNDGLNTVIPYADPLYRSLRPTIGLARESVIPLDGHSALHPSLTTLMPLWHDGTLAIVQGVGYPEPNLSHFRSTEIWDTASAPHEYRRDGWLARALTEHTSSSRDRRGAAVLGSAERGPFAAVCRGCGPGVLRPEVRSVQASHVSCGFSTRFPAGAFGAMIEAAARLAASSDLPDGRQGAGQGVAAMRLTLDGFDTHQNQTRAHSDRLAQLAQGVMALRSALAEFGLWDSTLVMTCAEFGRSVRENGQRGTDHGTVAPHFIAGGRVRGGLYGAAPQLARIDGQGNLPLGVDFRSMYATVLDRWWGIDSTRVLGERFETLPLLKA
jgi:uncharacterized protein (DUF1501 family)